MRQCHRPAPGRHRHRRAQRPFVRSTEDEQIEGTIFTYEAAFGVVVIEQRPPGETKATYRTLKTTFIKEQRVLAKPEDGSAKLGGHFASVNYDQLQQREQRAVQKAFEDMGHLNSDVSTLTQTIYDALRKTMPCAWDGETIVVLGEVRIPPPYTPEACQANAGSTALQRVQKVLAGEVAKLAPAGS